MSLPPVLLVHGTFSQGGLMQPWKRYFEDAGFECHAPSLPGRAPTDLEALRRLRIGDYVRRLLAYRAGLAAPPIVIGHSMGGLLAQQIAARTPCAALVLLASVPPGVLWAQPRTLPHLVRLLPGTLTGLPVLPSEHTLRAIVFHDLPEHEQRTLPSHLVADSGRAFRSLILGTAPRIPPKAVTCPVLCVSGGADRNVSPRLSRAIAARYHAEHHVHPERGHWIIAESQIGQIAPPVLNWIHRVTTTTDPPASPQWNAPHTSTWTAHSEPRFRARRTVCTCLDHDKRTRSRIMTKDEDSIRTVIQQWAGAVRNRDLDLVLADHSDDIVMFDVPPPHEGVHGIDAYRQTWPPFFEWLAQGGSFEIVSLDVTADDNVAYAHALLRCGTPQGLADNPASRLRLTLGLRKEHARWVVAHEHHSFPAE